MGKSLSLKFLKRSKSKEKEKCHIIVHILKGEPRGGSSRIQTLIFELIDKVNIDEPCIALNHSPVFCLCVSKE